MEDWRHVLAGRCPWCSFTGMVSKHAAKAHPERWDYFRGNHETVTLPERGSVYVPVGADVRALFIEVDGERVRL